MACIKNVIACENRIRANGKQCMMQTQSNYTVTAITLFLKVYVILYYDMTQPYYKMTQCLLLLV